MGKLLPDIRAGIKEEIILINLLENIDLYSINKKNLENWIQFQTEEVRVLTSFFDQLGEQVNINMLESLLFKAKNNLNYEFVLRLVVHVIEKNDFFLNEMFENLNDNTNKQNKRNTKTDCWFNGNEFVLIRNKIALFAKFAQVNSTKTKCEVYCRTRIHR